MKKYTLILFVLAFISLGINSASATPSDYDYDFNIAPGCTPTSAYSMSTGLPCPTPTSTFTQTLRYGMTNNAEVTELQRFLIAKGYLQGTPNGMLYQTTQDAIKRFQAAHSLTADGVVGLRTRTVLNSLQGNSMNNTQTNFPSSLQTTINVTFPQWCEAGHCASHTTGYTKVTGSQYYIWKNILTTLSGLGIIYASFVIYKESQIKKTPENKTFDNFLESKFENKVD